MNGKKSYMQINVHHQRRWMLENTENVIFMHSIILTYMVQQQYMRQNLKSNHNPAAYSKHQWYPFILFVREEWLFVAASLFLSNIYTKTDISFGKITSFYHIFFYWRRRWTKHTKNWQDQKIHKCLLENISFFMQNTHEWWFS